MCRVKAANREPIQRLGATMTRNISPPATAASSQSVLPTSAGSHRQRMKWIEEMDPFTIRFYYETTTAGQIQQLPAR